MVPSCTRKGELCNDEAPHELRSEQAGASEPVLNLHHKREPQAGWGFEKTKEKSLKRGWSPAYTLYKGCTRNQ